MTGLLRALHAETCKLKRTFAWKMVILAPAAVTALVLFATSQAPFSTLNLNGVRDKWIALTVLTFRVWALLMMPLYITLETALIAGVDHAGNHWKNLFVRPVARWTHYFAKLLVVTAMTAAGTVLVTMGILLNGKILARIQTEAAFGPIIPWQPILTNAVQIFGLTLLALAIQHWVSMRVRSFGAAIGTGIIGIVTGYFAVASQRMDAWPQYFPWALPLLVLAREPHDIPRLLLIANGLALAVAIVGAWDFTRREWNG